jgi:transposase InsO family protein
LVSRKWLAEVVSVEETSVQVQAAFCQALEAEGLMDQVTARLDGTVDLAIDDLTRPILLAMSDNGPQMTSGSTREFMALCAIHQHFGRPGTPTDQAWIESLFGHVKAEWPHCDDSGGGCGACLTRRPTGLMPGTRSVGSSRGHLLLWWRSWRGSDPWPHRPGAWFRTCRLAAAAATSSTDRAV